MTESTIVLPNGTLRLSAGSRTDVGRVRAVNEDSLLTRSPLFAVADGMGGHEHGDGALAEGRDEGSVARVDDVFGIVCSANDAVRALSRGGALSGTTLTGLLLVTPDEPSHDDVVEGEPHVEWALFNVGDSRVYRWDGTSLARLTIDHSAVQELVNAGLLSEAEAEEHPDRNIITRALGAEDVVDVDVWTRAITASETFLLCSDGLTKELSDDLIADRFRARASSGAGAEEFADELVRAALASGGRDNVTVVVVDSTLEPVVRAPDGV